MARRRRGLGLLAGPALELELVGKAGGAPVELGDAVEQPALRPGLGDPGAQLAELGLVRLPRGALDVDVGAQGGEDGAVGLASRLHLGPQLRREVITRRRPPRFDLGPQRLELLPDVGQRSPLGGEVVAQRGERGLIRLPGRPLPRQLVLEGPDPRRVGCRLEPHAEIRGGGPLGLEVGTEAAGGRPLRVELRSEIGRGGPLDVELRSQPGDLLELGSRSAAPARSAFSSVWREARRRSRRRGRR